LAAVTLLAASTRVELLSDGLWLDELHTAWTVAGGSELPARALAGNTGPVWFVLPAASVALFGWSEATLRLPSLVAGLLIPPALFLLVRKLAASRIAGLFAAVAAAVDANLLFFSVEARAYSAVQLAALVQLTLLWDLTERPSLQRAALLAVVSALLVHLHYTAGLLLVAEACFAVGWLAVSPAARATLARPLRVAAVGTALACAPLVPHVLDVGYRRNAWASFIPYAEVPDLFGLLPLARYLPVPAALVGAVWLLHRTAGERWRIRPARLRAVALAAAWLAIPVLAVWIPTHLGKAALFELRFVAASAIAPIALAAILLGCIDDATVRLGAAVIAATLLLATSPVFERVSVGTLERPVDEGWRDAVAEINAEPEHRDLPVLLRSGLIESDRLRTVDFAKKSPLYEFSLLPVATLYRIEPPERVVSPLRRRDIGNLARVQVELVKRHRGAWLLVRGSRVGALNASSGLRDGFARRGYAGHIAFDRSYGSVHLFRLQIDRMPAAAAGGAPPP
jgi:hypothetical protein